MIKICSFCFEKLETENQWADFAKFGEMTSFNTELHPNYEECDFHLNTEEYYQMALDQSTSCTGIFIKNYTNTVAHMIEVRKNKNQVADDYIFDLEMFLHKISKGCTYTHLIYEKPIIAENFKSSQVLFQLEGSVRALVKRYDEFSNARLDNIENASWREPVIIPNQKGNSNRKLASELSIRAIFNWSSVYGACLGTDRDVFEAMGIMFGWFIKSFDALGRPYIRGEKFYGNIGGFLLPFVSSQEVASKLDEAGIKSKWFVENPNKSIFENIVCAVERYQVVCVELCNSYSMLALSIECNIKWMNPDKMTVVLTAANFVDERLFSITGDSYHFTL